MVAGWPLVGREWEVRQLEALLADPDARGMVLAGPAGVGKTHLVRAAVETAAPQRSLFVRATRAAASVPLGAFAPFLPVDLGDGDEGVRLRRAALAIAITDGDGAGTRHTAGRRVVCIDDAHLLDHASAALVFQLALDSRVFVLVVIRSDDDASEMLVELWKDELPRVDLRPFDEGATTKVLEVALGGEVERSTAHALFEASSGNVLYLREMVSGLLDSGGLIEEGGLWRASGPLVPGARLGELIESRLRDLDDTERLVLEVVALGEPIGMAQLEARGWGDAQESLERRGLVTTERSDRRWLVRLAHPLHGELVRDQLTEVRRRQIVRGLADAIIATGMRRREDKRRTAVWLLETGAEADPEVLVAAARDALFGSDFEAVERFVAAAMERGADERGAGAQAAHILGRALDGMGRFGDAERVLAVAEQNATNTEERTLLALARADNLFRGMARVDDAEAVLVAAERDVDDPELRARIVCQRAVHASFDGRLGDVLALTEPLLDVREGVVFCEAALPASGALRNSGRLADAISLIEEALTVRKQLRDDVQAPVPAVYHVSRAMSMVEYGRIDDARAIAQRGYEGSARMNFAMGVGWLGMAYATAELAAGRLQSAARIARQSAVAFGTVEHPGARWGLEILAIAAAQRGDVLTAEEAIADYDAEPVTSIAVADPDAPRGRAWLAVSRGELREGRRILREAAERARAQGLVLNEAQYLFDCARLGDVAPIAGRIFELAPQLQGPFGAARVANVRALVERDATGLDTASDDLERCGARLLAAEAAQEAARLHRELGDGRAATAATNRARALTEQCEGARTPALALGGEAVVLSKREREVAALAGKGKSNREIAEALFVSTRTVENHLQRVYEKLGIRGREELPATVVGPSNVEPPNVEVSS